jgi:acetoin utilization deacetylase AcuC-like enzyme
LVPAFADFKPQVILVSSGFDGHIEDNMSDIKLTTEGFTWIIKLIVELAAEHAGGRLISVLEGGYSIRRLPELARNHIKILMEA